MSDDATFRPALEHAFWHAVRHLETLDSRPVGATVDLAQLRARFDRPLPNTDAATEEVIDELVRDAAGGIIGSAGGRFFGWVIGGSLPAALAADWLTSAWDQNADIHACGPAEAVIEEIAGAWLKVLFRLPNTASFAFVTGSFALVPSR
jgi:glutamate/tyrosine decarboxylase-like PLP-dependent enzyme